MKEMDPISKGKAKQELSFIFNNVLFKDPPQNILAGLLLVSMHDARKIVFKVLHGRGLKFDADSDLKYSNEVEKISEYWKKDSTIGESAKQLRETASCLALLADAFAIIDRGEQEDRNSDS